MTSSDAEIVESPCVRNCCLNEEDVCMGCGRALEEIRSWVYYSNVEKQELLQTAKKRLDQIRAKRRW